MSASSVADPAVTRVDGCPIRALVVDDKLALVELLSTVPPTPCTPWSGSSPSPGA